METGLGLGLGLIVIGLVAVLLVLGLLRMLPNKRSRTTVPQSSFDDLSNSEQTDAVIVVQSGGRVEYLNTPARVLFGIGENEHADLEQLSRRARPSNDFLFLFSKESIKRISIGSQLTEATSYRVPGYMPLMMVTLRNLDLIPAFNGKDGEISVSILRVIAEFGQSVTSSLDLDKTIKSVLDNVGLLISADVLELKLWDEVNKSLVPYRYEGRSDKARKLLRGEQSSFGDYSTSLLKERKPVFLRDTSMDEYKSGIERTETYSVRSYIGIPLLNGHDLVGTLEIGNLAGNSFDQQDLEMLNLVSGQTAVAIRNALYFEKQEKRTNELTGLANLAQAVNVSQNMYELFERLVKSISPLFDVEVLGFLLFSEGKRILEGQVPFQGLPPHIVEIYRTSIPIQGSAADILAEHKPLLTLNASEDKSWKTLGIQHVAQAASLRDSALVPLLADERMLGYFQLSNHRQGLIAFSEEELRLMNVVANQATAIIENAVLVQQARQRAYRSDSLRRIASLSSSAASIDEILAHSLREMAHLFQAEIAAVFLLDENRGELLLHSKSTYCIEEDLVDSLSRVAITDSQYRNTVSGSQKPILSGRLSTDINDVPVYRQMFTSLRMESAMVVPLVVHDRSLGEIFLGSRKPELFNSYDLQIVTTAAGQLASSLENAYLVKQTDENLRAHVDRMNSLMRIHRELNSSLDVNEILELIHSESLRITGADCGTILLTNPLKNGDSPKLGMSIGCVDEDYLKAMLVEIADVEEPLVVGDYEKEAASPPHEGVRSALFAPIRQDGNLAGVIHLHANKPNFFVEDIVNLVQTMAVQASSALKTANLYQAEQQQVEVLQRNAKMISSLMDINFGLNFDQPLEQQLRSLGNAISESTPFQAVLFSVYEPDTNMMRGLTGIGFSQERLGELTSQKQALTSVEQMLEPKYRIGQAYLIPAEKTPFLPGEEDLEASELKTDDKSNENTWGPEDKLYFLLKDTQDNPLGMLRLEAPEDGLRPDNSIIEALEIFATQAASVIINSTRINQFQNRVETLSSGLQRQQRLLNVSQNDLPFLLHKDLEQTLSIHDLDRRAQRLRAGLAITESVSKQLDYSSALLALGRQVLTQLSMSVALIAEVAPEGPRLLHILGSVPSATNPETLFGQRNPLRACLQTGKTILAANEDEADEWHDTPLLNGLRAKAFICLPITVQEKVVAALLAISPEPLPAFTDEDRQIYHQIARQTSVILQNISLLSETRRRLQEVDLLLDFSRQISGLSPDEIVKALLENAHRVIQPASHAGVVMLWDDDLSLLTPRTSAGYADNDSMMKINYKAGEALPGLVFETKSTRRVEELNFARDYALSAENLVLFREATGGRLPVSTLLIPIIAGDQALGVLVLDNFNTQSAFKLEDETLLSSLTQQVALSLENVRLVNKTEERAGQLQALNTVAAAMTSRLKSDELVSSLLDHVRTVLQFDTATLLLRDEDQLIVAAAHGFSDAEQRLGLSVAVSDSALFQEMIQGGRPISIGDVRQDTRFPQVEAPRLSWLGIPLISKGEVIGVITLEKWQLNFYTPEQVQVATTFASQAAAALENARLFEDSQNRAEELDRRSQRLALLNRYSSKMSGILDAGQILEHTAKELHQAFSALNVSVVNLGGQVVTWSFATAEQKYKLPKQLPDSPIFNRMRESQGVFTSENFKKEPDLIPLNPMLGNKKTSVIALPIVSGGSLSTILFIQIPVNQHLNPAEIELALTIANQASVALDGARLFQEVQQRAQEAAALAEVGRDVSATLDLEELLNRIVVYAKDLLQVETSAVHIPEPESNVLRGIAIVGKDSVDKKKTPLEIGEGILGVIAKRKVGEIVNNAENDPRGRRLQGTQNGVNEHLMSVPVLTKDRLTGLMTVWRSGRGLEFTESELKFLNSLAQQAAIAIENARLFAEINRLAEEMEQRVVERTSELEIEKANTETLLRILTEVSASLDLDRALSRTLALLNEAVGAEQGTVMLLHAEDNLLHYRAGYGYLSGIKQSKGYDFTLKVGEGLAGWVVEKREATLVEDLHKDHRWVSSGTKSSEHRSSIVTPLLVGEDVIGVLMIFHREVNFFGPEMLGLVRAIAGQVAIAINNAHLYELIRDQAERLGGMLRAEQEEASRSQAILEAVADGVVVTGPDARITFINSSASTILKLEPEKVIDQPSDSLGEIFGKAAIPWMETIANWSTDTSSFEIGESYAEQLELEDGHIALVHLAPVVLQEDFLGTVSIFRDITHEVEVDRLKSEFVATVSHELRTPMTSIRGYVDILLMGAAGVLNDDQTHFLDIVKNNAERLNILVDDLLDISRIEAGQITLSKESIDLRELAEDVLKDFSRNSKEDNKLMTFSLDADKNIPNVRGDLIRIRQVLGNLLDNAYHYTPEKGKVTVHIQATNGSEVQVDIKDSGVGIPVEEQERIFDRFYRGEDPLVLATPGTGLGLAIVNQLIEMHQGRLWMQSDGEGKGSTFSFTLPVDIKDE